jgi:hypothetical protein
MSNGAKGQTVWVAGVFTTDGFANIGLFTSKSEAVEHILEAAHLSEGPDWEEFEGVCDDARRAAKQSDMSDLINMIEWYTREWVDAGFVVMQKEKIR